LTKSAKVHLISITENLQAFNLSGWIAIHVDNNDGFNLVFKGNEKLTIKAEYQFPDTEPLSIDMKFKITNYEVKKMEKSDENEITIYFSNLNWEKYFEYISVSFDKRFPYLRFYQILYYLNNLIVNTSGESYFLYFHTLFEYSKKSSTGIKNTNSYPYYKTLKSLKDKEPSSLTYKFTDNQNLENSVSNFSRFEFYSPNFQGLLTRGGIKSQGLTFNYDDKSVVDYSDETASFYADTDTQFNTPVINFYPIKNNEILNMKKWNDLNNGFGFSAEFNGMFFREVGAVVFIDFDDLIPTSQYEDYSNSNELYTGNYLIQEIIHNVAPNKQYRQFIKFLKI